VKYLDRVRADGTGFALGSVVAGRRIDALAGAGGMGVVYRAWNVRLKRIEAVKVIAEHLARDQSFRQRFEREIEIAASIVHPHVVTVYDSGEGPGGQLFVAMQYVDGTSLDGLIGTRGRLEPTLAAALIAQVASALDAAHSQGLVHRDVKPGNILIAARERGYHVYLTDFGLAKHTASGRGITRTGMMVGTVDYMAPEQVHGRPVDLRADIYALGATLYKALTGEVPYPRGEDVARLMAKMSEPPPVPSRAVPGLAPALDTVIARAMSADPAGRYASAGELGEAIVAAAGPAQPAPPVRLGPGSMLGDCLLESVAGKGGMGVVYRATQVKLGRTVAVKVMSKELSDDTGFRSRFERECRLAAAIDHPSVVPIHWAGEASGVLYVVMRYVSGGSLREALATAGRLEPDRAIEVVEQLAGALDAAHARGLVHRDIKPGNILIDGESGRVLLGDFGLAKALDDTDSTDGEMLGTARYMAPERGRGGTLDEVRADVYSLGCVLWDMLAGTDRVEPSTVAGVPAELAKVVARATMLEPAARHASAGELADAARAALAGAVPTLPDDAGAGGAAGERVTVLAGAGRRQPFAPPPLSSGLRARVIAICDLALAGIRDGAARDSILAVRTAVSAPLRMAILGRSGSDRQALLSALLGRTLAIAELGTTVSFSHGSEELVAVEQPDGTRLTRPLRADGSIPEELLAAAVPSRTPLEVSLPIDGLRTVSLVYPASGMPGGGGAPPDRRVEAFLVAVRATPERSDAALRAELADACAGAGSAVNTICVLMRDDLVDDTAGVEAAAAKRALGPLVAGVIPFSRTLAVAANTGIGVPEVRAALELAQVEELTGVALTRMLRERSGVELVQLEIDGLVQRADALKAAQGLGALERLSYRGPELAFVRDRAEEARFEPRMHVLELVEALDRCVADRTALPSELLTGLERLVTGRTPARRLGLEEEAQPADLADGALEQFRAWKMFENGGQASPAAQRIAETVTRSLQLIAKELQSDLTTADWR